MELESYKGFITKLKYNEIFVFGSNLSGVHGAGAAKQALEFGAVKGVGIGWQGKTYAIPTKGFSSLGRFSAKPLPLKHIEVHCLEFLSFVKKRPDLVFILTEIGCGLAGYTIKEIAPLFKKGMNLPNIVFPESFKDELLRQN